MGKIVAFIPVRGGSKSIPLKNIREFCGKPLIYWTAKAANECKEIDVVYVATDSSKIEDTVKSMSLKKVKVIGRSAETATDEASTESAMIEFAGQYEFDEIILIQATSPLLTMENLENGIRKYQKEKYDSLLSVVCQKRFIWENKQSVTVPINYVPEKRPRRQDMKGYLVENGAFYITTRAQLLKTKTRLSGRIGSYEMSENTYFEIDEPSDWVIMENMKRQQLKNKIATSVNQINLFVMDVDGVLTDAGMYYDNIQGEMKKFNTRDGMGIELLREAGIQTMILTSESTEIVKRRAQKLHIDFCFMGVKNKKEKLDDFFAQHPEFMYSKTAYIGDDINDVEPLQLVGFSAVPADAMQQNKETAQYICQLKGGTGCVREVCEYLLATKSL